jgi:hypothetical protein
VGFGADVSKALTAREKWLIANRHARVEQPGTITPKPDMLRDLNLRGITVAAEKMSAQLGMPHYAPFEGMRMTAKHVGTIDLPMQRLAVVAEAISWRAPPLMDIKSGKWAEIPSPYTRAGARPQSGPDTCPVAKKGSANSYHLFRF